MTIMPPLGGHIFHDLDMASHMEDFHLLPLVKMVGQQFLNIFLFTHGQKYDVDEIQ